ncbi:hypothetical protein [Actinomadura sp. 6N118]|uniref:hypothetical protein n=1 Tax=Actinomadura sp. 6N118 TaxID=3375151 RepID=UPI0037BDFEFC
MGRHVITRWARTLGSPDKRPERIEGHDGLEWFVEEVAERWRHPDYIEHHKVPHGTVAEAYRLRVTGPAPGRPAQRAEQWVWLWQYGTGAGWWMGLDDPR